MEYELQNTIHIYTKTILMIRQSNEKKYHFVTSPSGCAYIIIIQTHPDPNEWINMCHVNESFFYSLYAYLAKNVRKHTAIMIKLNESRDCVPDFINPNSSTALSLFLALPLGRSGSFSYGVSSPPQQAARTKKKATMKQAHFERLHQIHSHTQTPNGRRILNTNYLDK